MNGFLMKAGLGTALAASALATATPATAQRWGHRHDRGSDVAAGALIGGVVGLGLGAAIASSNRGPYYDYPPRYRGYRGYYPQPYYNAYRPAWRGPRCFRQWRWDPYYGGRVPVRVCR